MAATKRKAGRPRANGSPTPGLSTREEVLNVAASLFTTRGYTATSTRAIADGAGLRQASLYNHFSCKEEILATLLGRTVRPALAYAQRLTAVDATPEARLWALARYDVHQLLSDEFNLGALFLLPEIAAPQFAEVREQRDELWAVYRGLIEQTGRRRGDEELATRLTCGLIESVAQSRPPAGEVDPDHVAAGIADAILLMLRCTPEQVAASCRTAARLVTP